MAQATDTPGNQQVAAPQPSMGSGIHGKHLLDPIDRFSEILFGLIMVLCFTGSLSVANARHEEVHTMLIGALGCNLAWGIVDAVMYLIGSVTQRRRDQAMLQAVMSADSPEQVRLALLPALHPAVASAMTDDELDRLRRRLRNGPADLSGSSLGRDIVAAAAVCALVFLCTLPVVLPFAIIRKPELALRVSNAVALTMLFFAGAKLGRLSGFGAWKTGVIMVMIGLGLVAITMALGG
jgi:VIT1/CCC1 family predicted Fe2+/Mn2+ transporter